MRHDFQQRKEQRIANAKKRAAKSKSEADSLYDSAREMASHIPLGQPILVGHHSEKADRRYREKIGNKLSNASKKLDMADYYERKAKTIEENDAIFSDDPDAIKKLQSKLESLQAKQDFMKSANECIKKRDKERFLELPNTSEQLWEQMNIPDVMGCIGFASYQLRNNATNIRQVKQRLTKLKNQISRQEIDKVVNGVRIFENKEVNRLQVIFESKPSEEIRRRLKMNGFRWSPSQNAWQRYFTSYAFKEAISIAESVED